MKIVVSPRVTTKVAGDSPIIVWDWQVWDDRLRLASETVLNKEEAIAKARIYARNVKLAKELKEQLEEPYVEEV